MPLSPRAFCLCFYSDMLSLHKKEERRERDELYRKTSWCIQLLHRSFMHELARERECFILDPFGDGHPLQRPQDQGVICFENSFWLQYVQQHSGSFAGDSSFHRALSFYQDKHKSKNNNNILYSSQREIKAVVRSHNEEHMSIILSHETHTHTPPFSQSAYTNSKPKITWNNAFSVKPKRKNSQIR